MLPTIFIAAIFLSLVASSISAIAILALAIGIVPSFLLVFGRASQDKLVLLLVSNLLFWLFYAIFCGALGLEEFGTTRFYSGEGRIFMYYVPFLTMMGMATEGKHLRVLDLSFRISAVIALFAVTLNLVGAMPASMKHRGGLSLLFSSHHSAGYFFSLGSIYFFSRINLKLASRKKWDLVFLLANFLALLSTNSRTSLLGLMIALSIFYAHKIFVPKAMISVVLAAFLSVTVIPPVLQAINPHLASKIGAIFDPRTFYAARTAVEYVASIQDPIPVSDELEDRQSNNITVRFYLWAIAIKKFVQSPILGMGMNRWNDQEYITHYAEIPHLARIAVDSTDRDLQLGNAHNAYLMFLAETGLFGFTLIMAFWMSLIGRLRRLTQEMRSSDPKGAIMAQSGLLMAYFVLGAGLTGNSFAAPSVGFLPLLIAGATISYSQTAKHKHASVDSPTYSAPPGGLKQA